MALLNTKRVIKCVRITLLVLSVSGWTVFAMGMVDVISNLIPSHKNETDSKDVDKSSLGVLSPMFLFLTSGFIIYVIMGLHILIDSVNCRHVLHSAIMFLSGFYLFAASATMIIVLMFVSNESITQVLNVPLTKRVSTMMLVGVSTAVGFYWLLMVLWPLSDWKWKRVFGYRQLRQMSQEKLGWD